MKALQEAHIDIREGGSSRVTSNRVRLQGDAPNPVAKQRPTAVFCGGDIMAMGAICAADELGLRVPQDISVIGYDNVRNARYFTRR